MSALTISFSDSIRVFGLAPSTKWGAFTWGTDKWGEGSPNGIQKSFGKYVQNDQASSDSSSKSVRKYVCSTQSTTAEMTDTKLTDGNGYSYVFPGGVTDAEERIDSTYTEVNGTSATWTEVTQSTTPWSEN